MNYPTQLENVLSSISGVLVTPFDDKSEIASDRLVPVLDQAIGAGLHLPVVNGNTGELYALTTDKACATVRAVVSLVDGRAPVLAGVGWGLHDAQMLARCPPM